MTEPPDDLIVSMMEADAERREQEERRRNANPGDDDHALSTRKIMAGLGCIDGLCRLEIRLIDVYSSSYEIHHWTPPHRREYHPIGYRAVRDQTPYAVETFIEERHHEYRIDGYLLERYQGDIVAEIIRQLRYKWNDSWPHHA